MISRPIAVFALVSFALLALPAQAGTMNDTDSDLVPDAFDNCTTRANGPNEPSNQLDCNLDGYGDACDPDYNDDGGTTTGDFLEFLQCFTGTFTTITLAACPCMDHDGNGAYSTADFLVFLDFFSNDNAPPGPSGLSCAGAIPCIP